MNTFLFTRKTEKAFTTGQLQAIHKSLQNLGYKPDFRGFYAGLAEYCEAYAEDAGLTDAEASPYISGCLLELLESLTQKNLRSKIFALCDGEKKLQTELKIPVLYVHRQDAVRIALSAFPRMKPLLDADGPELVPGFAPPVYGAVLPEFSPEPHMGKISRILLGTCETQKATEGLSPETPEGTVTIPAKLSLTVAADGFFYEIPLYCNTRGAAVIRTKSVPWDAVRRTDAILTEGGQLLGIRQYVKAFGAQVRSGYAGQSYEAPRRLKL